MKLLKTKQRQIIFWEKVIQLERIYALRQQEITVHQPHLGNCDKTEPLRNDQRKKKKQAQWPKKINDTQTPSGSTVEGEGGGVGISLHHANLKPFCRDCSKPRKSRHGP